MATITIDGQSIQAGADENIIDVALRAGIEIPRLCHFTGLTPVGSCRMCLVEVGDDVTPQAACTLAIRDGMDIRTETDDISELRRLNLQLLTQHYTRAANEASPDSEFEQLLARYGVVPPRDGARRYEVDNDANPFIRVDLNQCILCTRCVRVCQEVQGRNVWGVGYRGEDTKIIAGLDTGMMEARCESCGACADYCPTGALSDRFAHAQPLPDKRVLTTCGYCGVGCQFDLNVRDERIVGVSSRPDAPVNGRSLCVKGRYGWDFIHHADRLLKPRVRRYLLDGDPRPQDGSRGDWVEADWETALRIAATKIVQVKRETGADSVGVLSSAKCTNEENYLMQKFARQVVGTNNIDHCARLCHSSTVAGLAMAFGSGAMSNTMRDVAENAAAILIIGSNTTEQHPVFGAMIRQAVEMRGCQLVVADPRRIDIVEFAELHVRQKPGTDVALVNGIMHLAIENGWHDSTFLSDRCQGFEEVRRTVKRYTPEKVARITGVSVDDLARMTEILARKRPMAVIWSMGITQHTTGVMNVLSLANLQMLLGNMGVAGGGVNPLRGQNNVQGACDMGALPNVFPGYQPVSDSSLRDKFSAAWATSADASRSTDSVSPTAGLTVTEMLEEAGNGRIRALYILGEDPVMSEPDSLHAQQLLRDTEFVVLQEIFPSETSRFADVLLPGASFAEKEGTFTNTERRVQRIQEAISPLGESRPDWAVTSELANRILTLEERQPVGPQAGWDYPDAAAVMAEMAQVTPSYAGMSHPRLDREGGLHWPVLDDQHPGTPILHTKAFTRGKGQFHAVDHVPAKELPDADYPLLLTTGRVLYHWHGGEMTRRSQPLLKAYPETLIEISPEDARHLGLNNGDAVRVDSRRGRMNASALVTERVPPGVVFGTFHFPGTHNVNNLTINAVDPMAKIPEYKVCAVRLAKDGT